MAFGTLLPPPGIKPVPPALEAWSLNHWRAKKVPTSNFQNNNGKLFKIFKSNVTDLLLLDPVENRFFRIKEFVLVFGSFTFKLYTSTPLCIKRGQYNGYKHPISFLCFTREERKVLSRKMTSQLSSVTQSCPTLCDPMNRSTPGLPVHHQLPESTPNWTMARIQTFSVSTFLYQPGELRLPSDTDFCSVLYSTKFP